MRGRVLVIAGSDSGGGAGIQADIKTLTALGGYAATAVTAVTVQDTHGVSDIHVVPVPVIRAQMRAVLDDIGADCVKTGMLHDAAVINAVADELAGRDPALPLVLDPVMVAKGGAPLLAAAAQDALLRRLVPRASLLTPNLPEAEALSGIAIASVSDMEAAGARLRAAGAAAVLVKGGHLDSPNLDNPRVQDVLVTEAGAEVFDAPRLMTRHTHGTGCTLASAIACGLAQGLDVRAAVVRARAYVWEAIRTAPGLGGGHGPLNHAFPCGQWMPVSRQS
jgi:hydroxymethylpyrimidine/phosphomethylpyrimidine kinase